jgi:hypothetical protein
MWTLVTAIYSLIPFFFFDRHPRLSKRTFSKTGVVKLLAPHTEYPLRCGVYSARRDLPTPKSRLRLRQRQTHRL